MPVSPTIPRIILDTDPGGDDIFALFWLQSLAQRGLVDIVAITTAAGNVAAPKTFTSASQVLGLGGFGHVPVAKGVPIQDSTEDAAHIHGHDGMGNLSATLPAATHSYATAPDADDLIIEALMAAPGAITLIAIGPLTNLAAAEQKHPGILKQAKEIVIMGGAFHYPGNVTAHAEFNIWFNPEAAATVLQCRSDSVLIPLDVTRHLLFTPDMAQQVSQVHPDSTIAQFLTALCDFMVGTALSYRETSGKAGFLVHDAATLAYLFYPETLLLRRATVRVETQGKWTRGQTVIDRRAVPQAGANAWIALQVDETAFFTHFVDDLKIWLHSLQ